MLVRDILKTAGAAFSHEAGTDLAGGIQRGIPLSECRVLLGHVLQFNTAQLIARDDLEVSDELVVEFERLVKQRMQGSPIAYLTEHREFWSLPLYVNHNVLIPRHETELLVEEVIQRIGDLKVDVLELGTGSGAVALSLASELTHCRILATDVSEKALQVAKRNQRSLGFDNVMFLNSHWFEKLVDKRFDLICSNPPYIDKDDPHLTVGDLPYEPALALVSEDQGYADLAYIIEHSRYHLNDHGWLLLEHGFEQGPQVRQIFERFDYCEITTIKDLHGNDRVTEGKLRVKLSRYEKAEKSGC